MRWKVDELECEKIGSANSESIACDDARGNACLKKVEIKLII